ncbi:hypothetical protein ABMA28_000138 [Loxostege sticticalis]|uniref:DnaJ homolog subfamily C member 22 n=1 Tax=Loxostege sticticalis TaxID=481309 RepID=A0ABD0TR57_LOXSC
MSAKVESVPSKKSVIWAYVFWLFGGIFGVHHFYLRRDRHAFVWWTTLGGFGVGWFGEIFRIPRYVRDANEDPKYMLELVMRMSQNKKPPFSMNRFTGMLMVGYSWGQMMLYAVPPDEIWGINFRYLNYLIPLAAALGVWTVGNIGREQGGLKWPLVAAYVTYFTRYYIYDETIWFTLMVLASALAFDSFSKEWRIKKPVKRHVVKRIAVLAVCACLYLSLWVSYLYFQGIITDSEGNEVPIYEAFEHFFSSPWWLDAKQCLYDTYQYAQHHGWYEVWKQIIDLSDPHGEQNAYKVLGLGPESSQQEITSTWRRLSRENHPDKVKDESQRRAAQERFMEIQQAYEILSNSKHRRNRRNKKDNTDKGERQRHDEM